MSRVGARAVISGGRVILASVVDRGFYESLERNGYIRDGEVDALEAAYQASRGRLVVDGKEGWEAALAIISESRVDLPLFIVYSDLRRRGLMVWRGARRSTLVARRGGSKPIEVLVLYEGRPFSVGELAEWSRLASGDNHEPVVAVVDRLGVVTYYSVRASTILS